MKKVLFIFQSLLAAFAYFCFWITGNFYANEFQWSDHDVSFLKIIVKIGIVGAVAILGSIALHFIRLKKYGFLSKRPMLSGILFLLMMLVPVAWFGWILRGVFWEPLMNCFPMAVDTSELEHLAEHSIAAGILLIIQVGYFLLYYFTEKKSIATSKQFS